VETAGEDIERNLKNLGSDGSVESKGVERVREE
jgi:hypothetical protein